MTGMCPSSSAVEKSEMTPEYGDPGSCRLIALGCTGMRPSLDVEVCLRTRSTAPPKRNSTAYGWRWPTRVVERRFLGELTALENCLSRGYGDEHRRFGPHKRAKDVWQMRHGPAVMRRERSAMRLLGGHAWRRKK